MKTFTGSLIALLFSLTGFAQDWAPYVPGQVSYFEGYQGDSNKIVKRMPRAVFQRTGHQVMYFHDGLRSPCRADAVSISYSQYSLDSLMIDSTGFSYQVDSLQIDFPLNVPIGYTWRIPVKGLGLSGVDSVELRLDSIRWIEFLGILDSVRYYSTTALKQGVPQSHWMNEHGLWLSKHYGLIRTIGMMPITNTFTYGAVNFFPGKLTGQSNDTLQSGFTLPDVMDFFQYAPGDILKWKKHDMPDGIGIPQTWLYRDSIISVSQNDSTVQYDFVRSVQKDGNITHGHAGSYIYEREYFKFLMDAISLYIVGGKAPSVGETVWEIGEIELAGNDICIHGKFNGGSVGTGCSLGTIIDAFAELRVCLNKGYVFSLDGHSGGYTTFELLGRTNSGDTTGNTWPLGTPPIENQAISVYPNPASAQINLGLPRQVLLEGTLSIQDLTGRTVLQKPLNGQSTWPVRQLQPGLFLITVTTEDARYQTKLIVQ